MEKIKLSHINAEDTTYRITTDTSLDLLICSIKEIRLIHPPILIKKNTEFIILSGFRRIGACRYLEWNEIEAKVSEPDFLSADLKTRLQWAKIAISDNSLQRPLNLIEVSKSLNLLSEFFKSRKELAEAAAQLGLPGHPGVIRKIEKLCHMPLLVQDAIRSDTISFTIACELDTLGRETGIALAKLFDDLKLSLNKQREIITLAKEIGFREDISILDVLGTDALQRILNHPDLERNQKSQKIRFYLRQRRFPVITETEKAFEALVSSLNLGNNAKLIPPKDFEGTICNLNFSFQNLSELTAHQSVFDKLLQNPILKKIFED